MWSCAVIVCAGRLKQIMWRMLQLYDISFHFALALLHSPALLMNNDDRILICVVYRNGLSTHDDDMAMGVAPREKEPTTPSMLHRNVLGTKDNDSGDRVSKQKKRNVIRRDVLKGLRHANTLLNRFFSFFLFFAFAIFCFVCHIHSNKL